MSYYLLPIESMAGAMQLVWCLITMLTAAFTYMIVRH
jgi:hypothetical protein